MREPESGAVRARLARADRPVVTSAVARVELTRVARITMSGGQVLNELLRAVTLVAIDDDILSAAARFADASLRSLDAIHLATAVAIRADEMLVYDRRLAEAAEAVGITPVAPR